MRLWHWLRCLFIDYDRGCLGLGIEATEERIRQRHARRDAR